MCIKFVLKLFHPFLSQARHNGQNYVFALLTGYRDPPAGVSVNFKLLFLYSISKGCYFVFLAA